MTLFSGRIYTSTPTYFRAECAMQWKDEMENFFSIHGIECVDEVVCNIFFVGRNIRKASSPILRKLSDKNKNEENNLNKYMIGFDVQPDIEMLLDKGVDCELLKSSIFAISLHNIATINSKKRLNAGALDVIMAYCEKKSNLK